MMRTLFESSSAEDRVNRAARWLAQHAGPVTIVGASLDAAAEVARRAVVLRAAPQQHASLGWQRTTLAGLAASLARTELARLGLAPASPLALEAICARVVHDHSAALGRLTPIAERPGLPRALARTLGELRLARVEAIADPDLARLVAAYEAELAAAELADRAQTLQIAAHAARSAPPRAVLFVDVPLEHAAERDLVAAIMSGPSRPRPEGVGLHQDDPSRPRPEGVGLHQDDPSRPRPEGVGLHQDDPSRPRPEGVGLHQDDPSRPRPEGVGLHQDVLAVVPTGNLRAIALLRAALGENTKLEVAPPDPKQPLGPLYRGLFESAQTDVRVPDEAVTVLSAPGESRECVELARIVLAEAAKGTPLDRMAVLLRGPQYGAHVSEAFRRAGVPMFFARGTKRPDPTGRAFLALLACAADGLSAARFAEYLSLGEVPAEDANGAPPAAAPRTERVAVSDEETHRGMLGAAAEEEPIVVALPALAEEDRGVIGGTLRAPRHWERLLVEASVIGSAERWKSRLAGLARKLADDVTAYQKKDELNLAEGSGRELAALEALRRFALPLIDDLDALPQEATWGDWIEKLSALASRALRSPNRVLAVLSELEPMAKVAKISIKEVRLVLEPRLSQLRVAESGRRYGKVFVATTDEARGLTFEVVLIPGLAEKIFPQKVVEDPLLLDEVREKLSPELATNEERTQKERLALRLAIGAAARRVVLSYPRVDVEQARPRTPSFYGLEVLRVAEGKLGDFEHLAKRAAATAEARIGWPAPRRREDAVDEAEYDLALLRDVLDKPHDQVNGEGQYLVGEGANPHLARALRFRYQRWDPGQYTRSDGLVKPPPAALEAIQEHALTKRSFSPTALQNFAACPYRFLLSAVHKLAPREELEAIEDMDPLTRGSLTHDVLYRLFTELAANKEFPLRPAKLDAVRARLDIVLAETSAEYRDRLCPAIDRVWKDAVASIGSDIREQLRRMAEDTEWTPAHFELSFGLKDRRAQDATSKDEAVILDGGLQLRGSIDLVERSRTGALRAMDYKTGKVRAKKDETVIGGGETLQPVLYALTLEKLFPGTPIESGVLYYCTSVGNYEQVNVPLDETARNAAKMMATTVSDALNIGSLPAAPKLEKKGSACTWCDFKPVCGPYEEIRTRKKPEVGPLKALAQLRRQK